MSGTSTLTSANTVFMLSIPGLYNSPQQIQGFDVDEATNIDPITIAETKMGVDGFFAAGRIFAEIEQDVTLQANSPSISLFENWYAAQVSANTVYAATGTIIMPGLSLTYSLSQGFLKNYKPIADVRKILQPRRFRITWGQITGAPS